MSLAGDALGCGPYICKKAQSHGARVPRRRRLNVLINPNP